VDVGVKANNGDEKVDKGGSFFQEHNFDGADGLDKVQRNRHAAGVDAGDQGVNPVGVRKPEKALVVIADKDNPFGKPPVDDNQRH
jgi:hypothetical protein